MADLSKDDRLAELLTEMLVKQDRHEDVLKRILESNGEMLKVLERNTTALESLALRLTDNGTHEVRLIDLERTVFGERPGTFTRGPAPLKGPTGKGERASKPASKSKPKTKSKGK